MILIVFYAISEIFDQIHDKSIKISYLNLDNGFFFFGFNQFLNGNLFQINHTGNTIIKTNFLLKI